MIDTRRQVNRVLAITLFLNLAVAFGKIFTGYAIGALAVTADGFHSLADGTSNIVALIANTVAGTPPDDDHPYGHQRFETLAALGIGVLLFLTAWETVQSVIERLSGGEPPELTLPAFVVMFVTLFINIGVNRYQVRQGKRLRSEILIADAANTGADVFVTISVIISMALMVAFGWYWADIAAALIVVVLIARAAWQIVSRTGSVLVDTAPFSPEELTTIALQVPAVNNVTRARSRGASDNAQVDINVQVSAGTTAERIAAVADAIEDKIRAQLNGVTEVNVQFMPVEVDGRDYDALVQSNARALGLRAHRVHLNPTSKGEILEFHVEVPVGQTLNQAHEQVSQLEQTLQRRLPEIADVVTHIEPFAAVTPTVENRLDEADVDRISQRVMRLLQERHPTIDWHDLQVYSQGEAVGMTVHATLVPEVSIEAAHQLAGEAERMLRDKVKVLDRITIHTEPLA